jgi:DNA-binding transcriptional regulator YhcF (GntR family)
MNFINPIIAKPQKINKTIQKIILETIKFQHNDWQQKIVRKHKTYRWVSSVRIAKNLKVSTITVKRAYRRLAELGYTETIYNRSIDYCKSYFRFNKKIFDLFSKDADLYIDISNLKNQVHERKSDTLSKLKIKTNINTIGIEREKRLERDKELDRIWTLRRKAPRVDDFVRIGAGRLNIFWNRNMNLNALSGLILKKCGGNVDKFNAVIDKIIYTYKQMSTSVKNVYAFCFSFIDAEAKAEREQAQVIQNQNFLKAFAMKARMT